MTLYLRLAWRNMWRHTRRTLIIVLAMGLCLAMMMMYDGFLSGFNDAIYGNAIKVLGGNIQVHAAGYRANIDQMPLLPLANDQAVVKAALGQPQVLAASRRINTGGLLSNREGAFPVSISGLEPEQELNVNLVEQHVVAGRNLTAADADQVFIGKGLADAMNVTVGDRITMVGRSAHQQMRSRTMTVVGIFDLNMPDIEKQQVYISLSEAQSLYDLTGQSTEVVIALKQIGPEHAVMAALQPALAGDEIDSYETSFPELGTALNAKNGVMNVFSVIILLIAGIGILNLLLMAVIERTREIGLLGALGLRPGQISLLFILEGTMMGLAGIVVGIGLGLAFNGLLRLVGVDFTSLAGVTTYTALINGRLYPGWGLDKLPMRALTVAIIAALAAVIPAREAAHHEPAQALHFV
jgi:ABC-type lipoprotein release transport system permease subunit